MEITFGKVVGGLFVTAVFLWPSIKIMKAGKWDILVGILMTFGGIGLIGITAWLVGVATSFDITVWVGCAALITLIGVLVGIAIGLSDKKVNRPEQWAFFSLAALITAVVMTSGPTFTYFKEQFTSNTATLQSQVKKAQ